MTIIIHHTLDPAALAALTGLTAQLKALTAVLADEADTAQATAAIEAIRHKIALASESKPNPATEPSSGAKP